MISLIVLPEDREPTARAGISFFVSLDGCSLKFKSMFDCKPYVLPDKVFDCSRVDVSSIEKRAALGQFVFPGRTSRSRCSSFLNEKLYRSSSIR